MRPHLLIALVIGSTAGAAFSQSAVDTQESYVAKPLAQIARGSLIVLLPSIASQALIARAEGHVVGEVAKQLRAAGLRASVLDEASYSALLSAAEDSTDGNSSAIASGTADRRLRALPLIAEEICAQTKCVAIVEARIVSRRMKVRDRHAEWDGVARRLPFSNSSGNIHEFKGNAAGLSVAILAISASGKVMFRTYGGAAIPFEMDAVAKSARLRADLFADPDEVVEGVEVAIRPLVQAAGR